MKTAIVTAQNPAPWYEGYKFPADDISSFLYHESGGVFIVSIKSLYDFDVYYPKDCIDFLEWLKSHNKQRYGQGGIRLIPLRTEKRPPALMCNNEAKNLHVTLLRNRKMFALYPLLKHAIASLTTTD